MPARRRQYAWQFSGGEQQAIALGRALVANPDLLMVDELSLGLAPIVIERIYALIPEIVPHGVSMLIVEQDVSQGVSVAGHVHCLLEGHTSLAGRPDELTRGADRACLLWRQPGPVSESPLVIWLNIRRRGSLDWRLLRPLCLRAVVDVWRDEGDQPGARRLGCGRRLRRGVPGPAFTHARSLSFLIVVPIFGLLGYLVQRTLIQKSIDRDPFTTLLVTFGLSVVIENLLLEGYSANAQTVNIGALGYNSWHPGSIFYLSYVSLVVLASSVVVLGNAAVIPLQDEPRSTDSCGLRRSRGGAAEWHELSTHLRRGRRHRLRHCRSRRYRLRHDDPVHADERWHQPALRL